MVRLTICRRLRWAGQVTRIKGRSAFKISKDTPAGKRSLGRLRCRWQDNIKIELK